MILLLLFPLSMPTSQEKQATASKWLKKDRLMQRRLPQIEHIKPRQGFLGLAHF